MSDKEAALDALQTIINLSACHTMSKVNDKIIAESEIIKSALGKIPAELITDEVRVSCYYIGMVGHSVSISEARGQYKSGDQMCQSCGGRCL